jgi:SOS-response transcriptional repressor LexA
MRDMNAEKRKPLEAWQIEDAARLKDLFIRRWGKSQELFGETFGLGRQATVGNLLNGRRALNLDQATRFARGLGCAISDFSPTLGRKIMDIAQNDNGQSNVMPGPEIRGRVPLISWVQAGVWMEIVDNFVPGDAEEWIATTYHSKAGTFALRVQGDSMEPRFPEGCIIIVEPEEDALHGKFVVAKRPGENSATFKQLVVDGGQCYLKPLNPRYSLLEFTPGTQIVGVVKRMEMEV